MKSRTHQYQLLFSIAAMLLLPGFKCSRGPKETGEFVAKRFTINRVDEAHWECYLNRSNQCDTSKAGIAGEIKKMKVAGWDCNPSDNYSTEYPTFARCRKKQFPDKVNNNFEFEEEYAFYKNEEACRDDQERWVKINFQKDIKHIWIECDSNVREWSQVASFLNTVPVNDYVLGGNFK